MEKEDIKSLITSEINPLESRLDRLRERLETCQKLGFTSEESKIKSNIDLISSFLVTLERMWGYVDQISDSTNEQAKETGYKV